MGLNLRQMICSGAAIAVAVAVYLGLTPLLGHETAGWVCIVAAAPIAAAGFFTYDCLTFETIGGYGKPKTNIAKRKKVISIETK